MRLTRSITVAAALVAALAIVTGACGTTSGTAQSTPEPTVTVTAAASPVVMATLPVQVVKKMTWGVTPASSLLYPTTVTVRLPSAWVHKVTAYGVDGAVLLAPIGWTGSGLMCADGGEVATLHAVAGSAVAGQLAYEFRGNGPAVDSAAPYFPRARDYWAQFFGPNSGPPPAPRPGLVERVVDSKLAEYHLTSGPLVDDGLQVTGVARTTVTRGSSAIPEFDRLEAALPPSDHALASAILNYYLSPSMSADSGVPATLQSYIDAINGHDYRHYLLCFTSQQRHLLSVDGFTKAFSTTHDRDIVIHSIRVVGSGKAVARVTFTSTQNPGQGFGYAQDDWTLAYTMKLVGWQWLIANVAGSPVGVRAPSASPSPTASPSSTSDIIRWNQAIDYVGDYETVQGPVVSTDFARSSNGQPTFLNVGLDYPDAGRFIVVIWVEDRGNFPEAPEVMYSDKTIRVTGLIHSYEGCAQIEATSPDDIEIIP